MSDILITLIGVLAGCLMCFEGYKLFRLSLGIAGGAAGFVLGRFLIGLTGNLGITWSELGKSIFLILFTIGLGVLAFSLYMKALIIVTTIVCAFWFYDDFSFIFERVANSVLRTVFTYGAGIIAGVLIGIIVYYAQKWTISLFTALVGARIISGVLSPILWEVVLSGDATEGVQQQILGSDIFLNLPLVRVLVLVAFCTAGFVIQLKTFKK